MRQATGVCAVEVVVGEVLHEISRERGQPRHERAREGGSPALLKDRLLQALDIAVGLWPPSSDAPLLDAELLERGGEGAGAKHPELIKWVKEYAFIEGSDCPTAYRLNPEDLYS